MKFKLKQIEGINLTNPQNNDILAWDSIQEEFVNVEPETILTPDLETVLTVGNITGGEDILISDEDSIQGVLNFGTSYNSLILGINNESGSASFVPQNNIIGGTDNLNFSSNSLIIGINNQLGTHSNLNDGRNSIVFGQDNQISKDSLSQNNIIGGGNNIVNGSRNAIFSQNSNFKGNSILSFGPNNDIDRVNIGMIVGSYNVISGSSSLTNISEYSYIFGDNNEIDVPIRTIARNLILGRSNKMTRGANTLVNNAVFGRNNELTSIERQADSSFISGNSNYLSSNYSFISGSNNTVTNINSAILGGSGHNASGQRSVIIGGENNTNSGQRSVILGGSNISNSLNDMVVVSQLRIIEEPVQTNSGQILVRNSQGVIRQTDEVTFLGSTAGSVHEVIGGDNINISGSASYPEVNLDENITVNTIEITDGANGGYILISDSTGLASWTESSNIIAGITGSGTNNHLVRWDGTDAIKDSGVILDNDDNITGINDITVDGDAIIHGNVTINGTATTINTENLTVEDPLILLAKNQTGTPTLDSGIMVNRGTSINQVMFWDESEDYWTFASTNDNDEVTTINIDSYSTLKVGGFILEDGTEGLGKILTSNANGVATWDDIENLVSVTGSQNIDVNLSGNQYEVILKDDISVNTIEITDGANDGYILISNSSGLASWTSSNFVEHTGQTQGSVLFIDSNLNISEDNDNFFYDFDQKRLGIGEMSNLPSATLNVKGDLIIDYSGNLDDDVFVINGESGELFSVVDSLTGPLFNVNNYNEDTVFQVYSDNDEDHHIKFGAPPTANMARMTSLIKNVDNTNEDVYIFNENSNGGFVDYVVISGVNLRSGNIMATFDDTNLLWTESTTQDVGSVGVTFSMSMSGSNAHLECETDDNYTVKLIVREI